MRIVAVKHSLGVCVFLSGATALVAQLCLSRYLSTLIGASSVSTAIVILLFLIGLSIGALLTPTKICARRALVGIELFIAFWCTLIALLYFSLDHALIAQLAHYAHSHWQTTLARIIITGAWVLPITIAFGMHFPVVVRVLQGLALGSAAPSQHFYSINILGSAVVALLVPYTAFYWWGMQYTLLLFAGISALIAVVLWRVLPPFTPPDHRAPHAPNRLDWRIAAVSFGSGAFFFYLEMLWLHLVSTVIPANVYAYSKLIGIVLLSLAVAGIWVRKTCPHPDTRALRQYCFAITCALVALMPLSHAAWPYIGYAIDSIAPVSASYMQMELWQCLILAIVFAPIAVLAGMYYPILFNALNYQRTHARSPMAQLLFYNTAGCIVGSAVAIYVGIPHWGSEASLTFAWLCICIIALAMWLRYRALRFNQYIFLIVVGTISAITLPAWNTMELLAGRAIYRDRPYTETAFLSRIDEEFNSGFLAVRTEKVPNRFTRQPVSHAMVTNGKFEANDSGHLFHYMVPAIVASLHVRTPGNALIIGAGTGYSSWVVHALGFTSVDIAEISHARIFQAEQYFNAVNHNIFQQPGVRVWAEDGRNFLATHPDRYDLITVDLNAIWLANTTSLYSQEFYRLASQKLGDHGVFEQFFPVKNLDYHGVMMLLATAQSQFRYVSLFNVNGLVFMLASNSQLQLNHAMYKQYQTMPFFSFERSLLPIKHISEVQRMQFITPSRMSALLANDSAILNTDKNRFIEFRAPFMQPFTLEAFFKQFAPKS